MKEQSYIIIAATFMMSLQLLALLISGNAQQMVIFRHSYQPSNVAVREQHLFFF